MRDTIIALRLEAIDSSETAFTSVIDRAKTAMGTRGEQPVEDVGNQRETAAVGKKGSGDRSSCI